MGRCPNGSAKRGMNSNCSTSVPCQPIWTVGSDRIRLPRRTSWHGNLGFAKTRRLRGRHAERERGMDQWGKRFLRPAHRDLNKINLTDFDNTLRLWEFWYSQQLMDDRLTLKAGIMSVDRDFIVPEYITRSLRSISSTRRSSSPPWLSISTRSRDFPLRTIPCPPPPSVRWVC